MHNLFTNKPKQGFTLIELLVVIGILAVLAAIAIPSIAGIIDKARKSEDAQNIKTMEMAIETFASEARTYNSATFDLPRVENVLSAVNDGSTNYKELLKNFSDNKFSKDFYPATPLGLITTIENYSSLRGTKITIPAESGKDFYYNVDTGLIIKHDTNVLSREMLKTALLEQRNEDDLTGRWINMTAVIGRANDAGIDNRPADENFVKSYAGNDGGNISEQLSDFCYITTDGYIGLNDDYKGGLLPEKVVLPTYFQGIKVKGIRQYGFLNARGIKHIVLPEGAEKINERAFQSSDVQIVEFSSTINNVHPDAFYAAYSLRQIIVPENNSNFNAIDKVLYNKSYTNITLIPNTANFDIPDEVTHIVSLTNHSGLNKLQIGKNVSKIDFEPLRAFTYIDEITVHPDNPYFTIENGILYNKDKTEIIRVFKDSLYGTTFNVPENVTALRQGTFENTNFEVINIHKGVSTIDTYVFLVANKLKAINVEEANPYFKSVDGILYNKSMTTLLRYPPKKAFDASVLPNSLTYYGYRCMAGCQINGTFTFGPNITGMDGQTFADCTNLTKVILNSKLQTYSSNGNASIQTIVVTGANTMISGVLGGHSNLNVEMQTTSNVMFIEDRIVYTKDGKTVKAILGNNRDVYFREGTVTLESYTGYGKVFGTIYIPASVSQIHGSTFSHSTAQKILFGFSKDTLAGAYWGLTNTPIVQYDAQRP